MLFRLLSLVIGYFFGLFQTSYIFGKRHGLDIRTKGSGNAGMTNTMRVFGKKAGALVLICDALKCFLAFYAAYYLLGRGQSDPGILYGVYAGAGAMMGHDFPFYMGFKGGKGVACCAGFAIAIYLPAFVFGISVFLVVVFLSKYVSLGSLTAVLSFIVFVIIMGQTGHLAIAGAHRIECYIVMLLMAALVYWQHRANIGRLLSGTERRIGSKA